MSHKNFWYLVSCQDLTYTMLKYSYKSSDEFGYTGGLEALLSYHSKLKIENDDAGNCYVKLPFKHSFSDPMKGLIFYTTEELAEELKKAKYTRNNADPVPMS